MFTRMLGGERPPERTKRAAAKGLWLLLVAGPLLAACTRVEIEDHSLQFNQAAGSLGNRVMLLNVVRAAKGYPVQFSKVTSYSGSSRLDGGLNLNIPFIGAVVGSPNTAFPGGVTPNASVKTGVSQLQLADLSTAEFQRTLRRKVTANDFAYYRSQGWPKALVNTLLIEELLVEPELWKALKVAAGRTCSPEGSARMRPSEYQKVCNWLQSQATRSCIEKPADERASPEGDVVYAYPNDPRKHCYHERFQWFFAAIRVLPGASLDFDPKVNSDECQTTNALLKDIVSSAKDGKGKSKDAGKGTSETLKEGKISVEVNVKVAEKADKDDDASDKAKDGGSIGLNIPKGLRSLRAARPFEVPALAALRNQYLCLLKEGKTPIIINWRSAERMVRYLGEVLAVQGFGTGGRKITILSDEGDVVEMLRVESGRDPLGRGAAISVEGPEGESFRVPIPESASKDAHLSLRALGLVMESVNLAVSGKELPRTPTLFLSGG
jgi:hypothetical protein